MLQPRVRRDLSTSSVRTRVCARAPNRGGHSSPVDYTTFSGPWILLTFSRCGGHLSLFKTSLVKKNLANWTPSLGAGRQSGCVRRSGDSSAGACTLGHPKAWIGSSESESSLTLTNINGSSQRAAMFSRSCSRSGVSLVSSCY